MAGRAEAHPAPFSYLDLRLDAGGMNGTLVLHVVDVAHELGMTAPEPLLDAAAARAAFPNITAFLRDRLSFAADGRLLPLAWDGIEPAPDRHAVRLRFHTETTVRPGALSMRALLFPYDGIHQTFVNVYEDGALRYQGIFDRGTAERVYYA